MFKTLITNITKTSSFQNKNKFVSLSKKPFSALANLKVYSDPKDHENPKMDPFIISTVTGFLPRKDPIVDMPAKYRVLDSLLDRMRWNQPDGSEGLLAKHQFGEAVHSELSEIDFSEASEDMMLAMALYRDYCFLASAYLLEDCHHNWIKTGKYGLGRALLPKQIAKPLVRLAEIVQMKPFMEYNSGYALNNFFRKNKNEGVNIDNIDIKRSFINIKSEAGFILVHVAINQHSGNLVKAGMNVLNAAAADNRKEFNAGLTLMRDTLIYMNQEFERMYIESNPNDYNIFRTFILGIQNQPMFPSGVIYEGCFNNQPQQFRGESGANDSIIPFCDNIIQVTQNLPKNPLTDILRDFRSYRPKPHQDFLADTEKAACELSILEYGRKDPESLVGLLEVADQIRAFRHRHWILTNLYILSFSKHPVATGGSPIVTWLPNQLLTVIDYIKTNSKLLEGVELPSGLAYNYNAILRRAMADERIIRREVANRNKVIPERL